MRYYIATSLENMPAHNALRDRLGPGITYDWTLHGPVFRDGLARIAEVAERELNGIRDADVVIVLWPGGRGTHVELGAALALGKRVYFVSDVPGHHEACAETCAFYHHPLVTRVRTVEQLLACLETPADTIIRRLRSALLPFAERFTRFDNVGGGTLVAPSFPLQVFKDAHVVYTGGKECT